MEHATKTGRRAAVALLAGALASAEAVAAADVPSTPEEARPPARVSSVDGTYGRIEGDLAVVFAAGATFTSAGVRGTLDGRFRYLQTAGVFVTYEDGQSFGAPVDPGRVVVTGLEARPLFLGRWLLDMEQGPPRLDLLVDSLTLEMGMLFQQPHGGAFLSRPGLQVGAGIEVPIFPRASGLWLAVRGGLRFADSATTYGVTTTATDRSPYVTLTLGWQQLFVGHLVDAFDRPVR